jgi:hypothetical protein
MSTQVKEERDHAKEQAKAQMESIIEMVANLTREGAAENYVRDLTPEKVIELLADEESDENVTVDDLREQLAGLIADESIEPDDFEFDEDEARQTIQDDALSVLVRSDWYELGSEDNEPAEFEILLCTGGPAVRIVGDLDGGSPSRPRLQYQDWGTPWTEYFDVERDTLQTFCEQFYFGD